MAYSAFARYYDALTENVDYAGCADRLHGLIQAMGVRRSGIVLDVGCGTGSLSMALAALGYEVIGADPSAEMLSAAMTKQNGDGPAVLYLCQGMEELDLYGTVDAAVCMLDTVNHIPDEETLARGFANIALFLEPGGLFLFDVNTAYKHREVLADNAFVYDLDKLFCVWQNGYRQERDSVDITLDFFEKSGNGLYRRSTESFTEWIYSERLLRRLLEQAGLRVLRIFGEDGAAEPGEREQRLLYVAKKGDGV